MILCRFAFEMNGNQLIIDKINAAQRFYCFLMALAKPTIDKSFFERWEMAFII